MNKRQKAKEALLCYFGMAGLERRDGYMHPVIKEGIERIVDNIFDGVKQEVALELAAGWQDAKATIDAEARELAAGWLAADAEERRENEAES